jgi:hypothetical protein
VCQKRETWPEPVVWPSLRISETVIFVWRLRAGKWFGEVFHIGSDQEVSIGALFRLTAEAQVAANAGPEPGARR